MIQVEIGQYREVNKDKLKAFFSLVIHPAGQKIIECRYFVSGERRWFSFPCKVERYNEKTDYIPYISYLNKEYQQQLQEAVLKAIDNLTPEQKHAQAKNNPNPRQENFLQAQSSLSEGHPPF